MLVLRLANFDLKSVCLMIFLVFFPLPFFGPPLKSVDREVRLHKGPRERVLAFHLFELERWQKSHLITRFLCQLRRQGGTLGMRDAYRMGIVCSPHSNLTMHRDFFYASEWISVPCGVCSYVCACVCIHALRVGLHYLFAHLLQMCAVHFWSSQSFASHPVHSAGCPISCGKREPDIVCGAMWLTPARLPEE